MGVITPTLQKHARLHILPPHHLIQKQTSPPIALKRVSLLYKIHTIFEGFKNPLFLFLLIKCLVFLNKQKEMEIKNESNRIGSNT